MTVAEYEALCDRMRQAGSVAADSAELVGAPPYVRPKAPKAEKPQPVEGPLSVLLTLHGHCPSKKNQWARGGSGIMFLPADVKAQIEALTLQAMFGWKDIGGPVEHPDLTVRFFVVAARQDQDGMYTTLLDCLQAAGVIVNDNIKNFNGRKILEPCEFVPEAEERVEVLIEKR